MRRQFSFPVLRLLPLLLWVFMTLSGCGGDDGASVESGSTPGAGNQFLRIFVRPFAGQYTNTWSFDHDLPLGTFSESDSALGSRDVLTWRGSTRVMFWGDGRFHDGYDWALPEGTPLKAVADGEVFFAGLEEPFTCGSKGAVAALIVGIRHAVAESTIYESLYVHMSRVDVAVGESVSAGQLIGLSGNTGCSFGPHLHLTVRKVTQSGDKVVVDPFGWEGGGDDPWEVYNGGGRSYWLWKEGEAPQGEYVE